MAERIDYLLIGGGLASAQAARSIREAGGEGRVAIVGAEPELPYNRPPLSKGFLQGKEEKDHIYVKPADFWAQQKVELLTGRRAVALNRKAKLVRLDDGTELAFGKLLLATGAEPRHLKLPGGDLGGVHYLRTVEDSTAIKHAAAQAGNAIVVGGGFIGAEVAASLKTLGLDVTLLDRGEVLLQRQVGPAAGRYLTRYFETKGVAVLPDTQAQGFSGEGRVRGVRIKADVDLPADLVVVGVGVSPRTLLAETAGLKVDNGVWVDETLRTEDPDIYAAGDITNFPDPRYGHRLRIEHWDHAKASGKAAGQNMAGANQPFDHLHYFFSDDFDLSLEAWGDMYQVDEVLERPGADGGHPRWFYLHRGYLNAALAINAAKEERKALQALLKSRPKVDESLTVQLTDPQMELAKVQA